MPPQGSLLCPLFWCSSNPTWACVSPRRLHAWRNLQTTSPIRRGNRNTSQDLGLMVPWTGAHEGCSLLPPSALPLLMGRGPRRLGRSPGWSRVEMSVKESWVPVEERTAGFNLRFKKVPPNAEVPGSLLGFMQAQASKKLMRGSRWLTLNLKTIATQRWHWQDTVSTASQGEVMVEKKAWMRKLLDGDHRTQPQNPETEWRHGLPSEGVEDGNSLSWRIGSS